MRVSCSQIYVVQRQQYTDIAVISRISDKLQHFKLVPQIKITYRLVQHYPVCSLYKGPGQSHFLPLPARKVCHRLLSQSLKTHALQY